MEGKFLFIYNSITNNNLNPGHNIKKFWRGRFVAVKFSNYTINFKSKTNQKDTFKYYFCLWSIYFVNGDQSMSASTKQKPNPNKCIISPSKTRKNSIKTNQIQKSATSSRQK